MQANSTDSTLESSPLPLHHKTATSQTIKDRKLIAERVQKNQLYYNKMEQALGVVLNRKTRKDDLLAYAKRIIAANGLKIERLIKRSKPVLICWFCEHMDLVPLLSHLIHKQEMVEKYGPAEAFNSSPKQSNEENTRTQVNLEEVVGTAGKELPKIETEQFLTDFFENEDDFKFEIEEDSLIV